MAAAEAEANRFDPDQAANDILELEKQIDELEALDDITKGYEIA